ERHRQRHIVRDGRTVDRIHRKRVIPGLNHFAETISCPPARPHEPSARRERSAVGNDGEPKPTAPQCTSCLRVKRRKRDFPTDSECRLSALIAMMTSEQGTAHPPNQQQERDRHTENSNDNSPTVCRHPGACAELHGEGVPFGSSIG